MKSKKSIAVWLLLLAVFSYSCGKKGQQKELNVFIWSEYLPEEVFLQFEQTTGIRVNRSFYASNEEMMSKLQAGGSFYDLAVPSDYVIQALVSQKLVQPVDLAKIPNFANLDSSYLNRSFDPKNRYTVPYMAGPTLIAYNSKKVREPITSYRDLWRPEFSNSLVMLDDVRALLGMTLKSMGKSMSETDPRVLEQAKQELKKLMPNIKSFDSDSPKTMLINGEATAGYVWGAEAARASRENPDIRVAMPKEGLWFVLDSFVIPAGAKNSEAAYQFINFILEPEVSANITRLYPYTNPNREAVKLLEPEYINDPAVFPPAEEVKRGELITDVGEALAIYDQIWSEVKQ